MPERKKLLEGFKKFRNRYYDQTDTMKKLVEDGANPDFFVIHCIDPRSGANTVFNSAPGEIFGKRTMAALVPPYEEASDFSASLTYAVEHKKIKHVIVLGHTQCGGIDALVQNIEDKEISGWMGKARKAFERAKNKLNNNNHDALCAETEKEAVILGLENLMSYPAVKKAVKNGDITLNGWLFDMKKGAILGYDVGTKSFKDLTSPDYPQEKFTRKL